MKLRLWHLICIGAFGAVLFVVGCVVLGILQTLVDGIVKKAVALVKGGPATELWEKPPFAIWMQFWIFNITNPWDVLLRGDTPKFEELGPYSYRETMFKRDLVWQNDSHLVSYRNYKYYVFDQDSSYGRESDLVVVPNIPFWVLQKMLRTQSPSVRKAVSLVLDAFLAEHPLLVNGVQAGDLIYHGYQDRFFSAIRGLLQKLLDLPFLDDAVKEKIRELLKTLPDRIGIFYGKNYTFDGDYLIHTGLNDPENVGRILQWNNDSQIGWWGTGQANMINGTDGTVFAPFISKGDRLPIFVTDICRSIYLVYKGKSSVQGIGTYRFTLPEEVFDAAVPENEGFCVDQGHSDFFRQFCYGEEWWDRVVRGNHCLPSGFLDVEGCLGAPVVLSSPHFLYCPQCTRQCMGWPGPPDTYSDQTVVDVEPLSGAGLHIERRLQASVKMTPDPAVPTLRQLNPVLMPLLWLNETATVDSATASQVRLQVVVLPKLGLGLGLLAILLGLLLLAALLGVLLRRRYLANQGELEDDGEVAPIVDAADVPEVTGPAWVA